MPESGLTRWLLRVTAALSAAGVPHVVVGGLAVGVWAKPRATMDIDLALATSALPAARQALRDLGVRHTGRSVTSFKRLRLLRVLAPPDVSAEPIVVDLLLLPEEYGRSLLARGARLPAGDGDGDAPFASAEDVILLKLMRDSDQDRADVRAILAAQPIDRVYLRAWARRLRLLARLRRYLG